MNHPSVIKHFISNTADLSWTRTVKFNHHNSVAHCSGTPGKFPSPESMPPRPGCYGCLLTREEAGAPPPPGPAPHLSDSAGSVPAPPRGTRGPPLRCPGRVRERAGRGPSRQSCLEIREWGESIRWQSICGEEQVEGGVS